MHSPLNSWTFHCNTPSKSIQYRYTLWEMQHRVQCIAKLKTCFILAVDLPLPPPKWAFVVRCIQWHEANTCKHKYSNQYYSTRCNTHYITNKIRCACKIYQTLTCMSSKLMLLHFFDAKVYNIKVHNQYHNIISHNIPYTKE